MHVLFFCRVAQETGTTSFCVELLLFGKKEGDRAESVLTAIIILHIFCPQINFKIFFKHL